MTLPLMQNLGERLHIEYRGAFNNNRIVKKHSDCQTAMNFHPLFCFHIYTRLELNYMVGNFESPRDKYNNSIAATGKNVVCTYLS